MTRKDIQILRAVSVLAVLLFHASPQRFPLGYLGVDIFFVISGFLVTPMIINAINQDSREFHESWSNLKFFYKKRIYRLVPSMLSTVVITTFLTLVFIAPGDFRKTFGQTCLSLIGIGNLGATLFAGDYFSPHPNPLLHTWSLAVEEQIYLFLPLILIYLLKRKRNSDRKVILFLVLLSLVISLGTQLLWPNIPLASEFEFYSPFTRFYEFGLGALASNFFGNYQKLKPNKAIILLCISCGLLLPFGNHDLTKLFLLALTFIYLKYENTVIKGIRIRELIWIGNRSYSIYLLHMPLLYVAFYTPLWKDYQHREPLKFVALLLVFPLAHLNHVFIENKWRIYGKENLSPRKLRIIVVRWLFLPVVASLILFAGSYGSFFGLNPNEKPLPDPSLSLGVCYSIEGKNPCTVGNSGKTRKVLLVGDSHARHLGLSFVRSARLNGLTPIIWTQSGCQFILQASIKTQDWPSLSEKYGIRHIGETQSCFAHNLEIIKWLKENPGTLVVTTFRSTSMVQNDLGIEPKNYQLLLAKNLYIMSKETPKLVILGPNPEYLDKTGFFGGGTLLWQKPYEKSAPVVVSRLRMSPNAFDDNNFYSKYFANLPRIKFINGVTPFCTEARCVRKIQNHWLYTDVDHLSLHGTELLRISSLDSAIKDAVA